MILRNVFLRFSIWRPTWGFGIALDQPRLSRDGGVNSRSRCHFSRYPRALLTVPLAASPSLHCIRFIVYTSFFRYTLCIRADRSAIFEMEARLKLASKIRADKRTKVSTYVHVPVLTHNFALLSAFG